MKARQTNILSGFQYLKNDIHHKIRTLPYISGFENLPTDIQDSVYEYLELQPVFKNRCWYNSHKLHLHNLNIDVEHGYYFPYDLNKVGIYEKIKHNWEQLYKYLEPHNFLKGSTKKLVIYPTDELYEYRENLGYDGNEFHDQKLCVPKVFTWNSKIGTYLPLYRHSWNSYQGIHFDLMCPLLKEDYPDYEWIYYFNTDYKSNYKNWKRKNLMKLERDINGVGITFDNKTDNINPFTKSERFVKTNYKNNK